MSSFTVEQNLKKAKSLVSKGKSNEALFFYKEIIDKFPKNNRAIMGIQQLKENNKSYSEKNLIAIYNKKEFEKVIEQINGLISDLNSSFILLKLLGLSYYQLKDWHCAEINLKKAIKINENDFNIYIILGNISKTKKQFNEAKNFYLKSISINSKNSEPHNCIGNMYKEEDNISQAIISYQQAININNNIPEIHFNLGNCFYEQNRNLDAIKSYQKAIMINSEYKPAYINLGLCLQNLEFKSYDHNLETTILKLLEKQNFVRPAEICKSSLSLIKLNPKIQKLFNNLDLEKGIDEKIWELYENRLLIKLMSICPLSDLYFEEKLKSIRCHILLNIEQLSDDTKTLTIQSVLAIQSFINEFIYIETDEEIEALLGLQNSIENSLLEGKKPNINKIMCLASYKPLYDFDWYESLSFPKSLEKFSKLILYDTIFERKISSTIKRLTTIKDPISLKVKSQYEQNPYPRWVNTSVSYKNITIADIIDASKLRLIDNKVKFNNSPTILVAGCGTGQEIISLASGLKNSSILGIDLSLTSLSYAKRKTNELGINNINYMQADILELNKLDQKFDIVQSSGVLHHLKEPKQGWRVLTNLVKVGGLMYISLYSKYARENITKIREDIANKGIIKNNYTIKKFRQKISESNEEFYNNLKNSSDFYSMSNFRDLIFHEQEHHFTIKEIKKDLADLGLEFCGFETYPIVKQFRVKYPNFVDQYQLENWEVFEQQNRKIFGRMYQFWCQKII